MNKKVIFSIVLVIVVALGAVDFFASGYADQIKVQASVQDLVEIGQTFAEKVNKQNPEIVLEEESISTTIFNKIDLDKVDEIKGSKTFLLTKNGANYFRLYTFNFASAENQINYLMLKTLFDDLNKLNPGISINEVNPYGINSFYVNDTNDESIVRLIILTSNGVYGVEYLRTLDKETSVDPLLSILTDEDNSDTQDAKKE